MTLDEYCEIYLRAWKTPDFEESRRRFEEFKKNFEAELSQRFTPLQTEDIEWFNHALEDDLKNKFVAHVFFRSNIVLPEELYEPILRRSLRDKSKLQPIFCRTLYRSIWATSGEQLI